MGTEALSRAAAAAGYAMAPIDEVDYDVGPAASVVRGEAAARGARPPKEDQPVVESRTLAIAGPVTRSVRSSAQGLIGQSQSVGQAVYGYLAGRGATA